MRKARVYINAQLLPNNSLDLPPEVSHYLGKVLRVKAGHTLSLFNGDGYQYEAIVANVSKKAVTVDLAQRALGPAPSPLATHLGQVMSRGDRMDYAVQKACELGVTEITPLSSERCEVKLDPARMQKRLSHWQQIAISACEQSGRCDLPNINAPQDINTWIASRQEDKKLVFHPHLNAQSTATHDSAADQTPNSCAMLIGPEGGLSEAEVALAQTHAFEGLALGPRVLRTETAPVAALTLVQHWWGDL